MFFVICLVKANERYNFAIKIQTLCCINRNNGKIHFIFVSLAVEHPYTHIGIVLAIQLFGRFTDSGHFQSDRRLHILQD